MDEGRAQHAPDDAPTNLPPSRHRSFARHRSYAPMLTDDFRPSPLWLEEAPGAPIADAALPGRTDVVVVGSGYTGLNAALELARGGRETLLLEAGAPGQGCSTRNGGQVSGDVGPSLARLARRHGLERARAIRREGVNALDHLEALVRRESIDCDFVRSGHYHAAHTPRHYAALARELTNPADETLAGAILVPRAEQRRELGTDRYHGGAVFPRDASLHPARYHRALLARARAAGATLVAGCAVRSIARAGHGFVVTSERGTVRANDVIVATNGYTGPASAWLRRRVVPIGSYVVATESLPEALVDTLFPTRRTVTDTRKVVHYYRASADRRRVVFGGRVSAGEIDPRRSAPLLHAELARLFPALAGTRLSHSWSGTVAFTFDGLPHIGVHDGVHHAIGYGGSGVAMASYLGHRLGQRLLRRGSGGTAFDGLPFATRPLYTGNPWFLPAAVAWYRWHDRRGRTRADG